VQITSQEVSRRPAVYGVAGVVLEVSGLS